MKLGIGLGLGRSFGDVAGVPPASVSGLVAGWEPTAGFYQDTAGTSPATTTGQSVPRWDASNSTQLLNSLGSFVGTFRKDALASGKHAVRLASGFLITGNIGPLDRSACTTLALIRRNGTANVPLANFLSTGGDLSSATPWFTTGYQRLGLLTLGAVPQNVYGWPVNQFALVGVVSGGSGYFYVVNGRKSPVGSALSPASYQGLGLGTIPGVLSDCDVAGLWHYSRALSDSEWQGVAAYCASAYGLTTPARAVNVVFSGNSITSGNGSTFDPFCNVAAVGAGVSEFDYRNYGVDGATTDYLVGRDAGIAAGLYDSSVGVKNVACLWEATNRIAANASAATALSDQASWCSLWRAAGFTVVTATVVDRTSYFSGGQTSGGFATSQATYNAALLANAGGVYGDYVVDLTSVTTAGTAGDGTHPTQSGHTSIGGLWATQLASAVAG